MTFPLIKKTAVAAAAAMVVAMLPTAAVAQDPAEKAMQMEYLDRGVVAMPADAGHIYIGWRMLGTDPDEIAFNVYRRQGDGEERKLNDQPITDSTNFVDEEIELEGEVSYAVRPVIDGEEQEASESFTVAEDAGPYLSIPIDTPEGYTPNDASAADLDGDGRYEIVLMQLGQARDNSQTVKTDPVIMQAYQLDGTKMWEINLGHNIRAGAHYTQFQVYDYDGDGRAEMVLKTSDGVVDGKGNVLGDPDAEHFNEAGHVLRGPEWLTLFDGRTGEALDTVDYVPARTPNNPQDPDLQEYRAQWGDDYGNRGERYLAGTAYLDGERPSVIMARGYYTRTALAAWDVRDGKLVQRWLFDTGPDPDNPYYGQGNHQLSVADVDGDGRQEIIYGAAVIDDDGTGLHSTRLNHGDALHVGDFDPDRPGLEVWMPHETSASGASFRDAKTGEILFEYDDPADVGRGCAGDIDPRYPGAEVWASTGCPMYSAKGEEIGPSRLPMNFMVWWDGDLLRELLDGNQISKWNWEEQKAESLLTAEGASSNNGTKATPTLSADLLGDWREEVIWRADDGKELRLYTTTIPTEHRLRTLMHDPQYRVAIAWQNTAYNQPPHPRFYIGPDMQDPPKLNIEMVRAGAAEASAE